MTIERLRSAAREIWRQTVITARLAVGVPDYDTYVEHQRLHHAQRTPMSRQEFFRERMDARYARGRNRCC
ncbi:MAG: CstA-like transporter-associated (seleno)protein [Tahibacter sp.]